MPTPSVFMVGERVPFVINPSLEQSNRVPVYYATNRLPVIDQKSPTYTIFGNRDLRLGIADLRIGTEETTWDKIYSISMSDDNKNRPRLYLENLNELIKLEEEDSVNSLTKDNNPFFISINRELESSSDKDIMVYVHGANSSVYRASAQAAQYRHFTGRNSVVIAFLWPSAESLFKYNLDVRHAAKTVPVFIRFLARIFHESGSFSCKASSVCTPRALASQRSNSLRQTLDNAANERTRLARRVKIKMAGILKLKLQTVFFSLL